MQNVANGASGEATGSNGQGGQTSQSLQEDFARRLQQDATGLQKRAFAFPNMLLACSARKTTGSCSAELASALPLQLKCGTSASPEATGHLVWPD